MENATLPLEKELEPIFTEKLPSFPENVKDILVQIAPWLALLGAIIGVLSFLTVLGVGSFATLISIGNTSYGGSAWAMWLGLLSLGLMTVICGLAFKPLQNKERKAWTYMYWLSLVSFVINILSGSIISAIFGAFIGFWILFQVRSRYIN